MGTADDIRRASTMALIYRMLADEWERISDEDRGDRTVSEWLRDLAKEADRSREFMERQRHEGGM